MILGREIDDLIRAGLIKVWLAKPHLLPAGAALESSNISGKRLLNCSATPLPMTPTQLTVFTRVCAWLSNKSPRSALKMDML